MGKLLNIAAAALMAASVLLSGCNDDEGLVVPSGLVIEDTVVSAEGKMTVGGVGFKTGDALVFETKDAVYRFQVILGEENIDSEGVSFALPSNFVYGEEYRVYLVRDLERAELGVVSITSPD